MQILFITNVFPNPFEPTKGTFNQSLARALATNHEIRVISPISWTVEWAKSGNPRATMPPERRETRDGIQISYPRYVYPPKVMRRQYGWFFWQSVRRTARRAVKKNRPDVILAYWAHPDGEAAVRLGRWCGVPVVVMVGGSDVLLLTSAAGRRRRVISVLQSADAVVTVGADLTEKLIEFGIDRARVHTVARGVDTSLFAPGDRAVARDRLKVPNIGKMLLWVGRMELVKGLDVLLEACTLLRQHGNTFRVYVVGDGSLRQALEADSRQRGLSNHVTFVGGVSHDQLPQWYRAADLTVLPSRSEGVPNVLRESLACGTPFVASRVGGIPELAGITGNYLVPPGDAAALAEALGQALAMPVKLPDGMYCSQSWIESAAALVSVFRSLASRSKIAVPS
jgi:glycosyltransferase involved in cell wall biosynthesis